LQWPAQQLPSSAVGNFMLDSMASREIFELPATDLHLH
jgi:hypothetical protein